ncbi:MAG: DUF4276 family protein [Prosthecobacter sp.]|uniref:DUF4276 family protein n=1 Tax=Prosthecobacter sp. TaxID=1965333 RepID=UPI003901C460
MKRLFIYVEGLTEEIFVERILRGHLWLYGVKVERPLPAKKDSDPEGPRGGFTNWPAMEADMRDWFAAHPDRPGSPARFSTLLDLYAMPAEVPGYQGRGAATTEVDVTAIETAIAGRLNEPRFLPYLQRHEFEALLLSHPPALSEVFPNSAAEVSVLEASIAGMQPEDINHGRTTHPVARIMSAIPNYYELKASNAFWVASIIGLEVMRSKCPRFDAWLTHWEQWGMPS